MRESLPQATEPAEYSEVLKDERVLWQAMDEIRERHNLDGALSRYPGGSCPVFAAGDEHVIKLFAPWFREHFATERQVLEHLGGKLSVRTPILRDTGEIDGWPYILMEKLPGQELRRAWDLIPPRRRLELAVELGRALAELHALPTGSLDALPGRWAAFLDEQRRTAVSRQAARGVDACWLEQIPDLLASVELGPPERPALLHTEIMREHVLVVEQGGVWRLSGLLDFEPAMIGHPEYEFASVGLFYSEGDAAILGAVLLGYGVPPGEIAGDLPRRFMAYALLHRYSNLRWYLSRMPPRPGVATLADLAHQWWAVRSDAR